MEILKVMFECVDPAVFLISLRTLFCKAGPMNLQKLHFNSGDIAYQII